MASGKKKGKMEISQNHTFEESEYSATPFFYGYMPIALTRTEPEQIVVATGGRMYFIFCMKRLSFREICSSYRDN